MESSPLGAAASVHQLGPTLDDNAGSTITRTFTFDARGGDRGGFGGFAENLAQTKEVVTIGLGLRNKKRQIRGALVEEAALVIARPTA